MKKTQCPVCNSDVIIGDDAYKGDILNCSNCDSELEIISLAPPSLLEMNDNSFEDLDTEETE